MNDLLKKILRHGFGPVLGLLVGGAVMLAVKYDPEGTYPDSECLKVCVAECTAEAIPPKPSLADEQESAVVAIEVEDAPASL
jgi:hypothetical protein